MIGDAELHEAVQQLPEWLPRQRWFAGKGAAIESVSLLSASLIHDAMPRVWHTIVEVNGRDIYQVPLSFRRDAVDQLEHVLVGQTESAHIYDALHDREATGALLRLLADTPEVGDLTFHSEPDAPLPLDEPPLVLPVEQSNTSVAYGDVALLKVFRRVRAGLNPDVEIHHALTQTGSKDIASLLGWLDGTWSNGSGEHHGSLAMLQEYLTTASDGWAVATASVRDLYAEGDLYAYEVGGDFAAESHRLGVATAEVHRAMAAVLPTRELSASDLSDVAGRMTRRLIDALSVAPELEPSIPALRRRIDAVRDLTAPVPIQRIHGDLHLGQVLRTVLGWKLIDFEGEPTRPLAERTALDSPLRDVAGMLRSFDYAAQHLLITDHGPDDPAHEQIVFRAKEWSERNREAFCAGYAEAGDLDLERDSALLDAYEVDKAAYEVAYEARHRPAWLPIPLAAVARLAGG